MDRNTFFDNLKSYNANSLHNNITNKHASNRFEFYDSLQHHGIKGQKWGIRRYQNPDGTLTEEGKQRYLNPDGTLTKEARKELKPDQQLKIRQEFYKKQSEEGTGEYADNAIYDENKQKEKLNNAKQNKMYDLTFVETIQNAENLSDDDVNREYEAYLKNPRKYMQEFSVDSMGNIKSSLSGSTTNKNKPTKQETAKTENTEKTEKQLKEDLKEEAKSAFGPKATPEEESKFWKALAAEYEKGNIKSSNSTKTSKEEKQKLSKEEKKEAKAAQKEVQKNLKGGLINNWALLNKAIEQAGITDTKNMSASDWNKVNDIIQDMRGSKKKK